MSRIRISRLQTVMLLLLFLCQGSDCSSATVQGRAVKQLTIDDGLSQNMVLAILQDNRGFIWLGTRAGLNRYDGYQCRVFRPEAGNPGALRGVVVFALHEDDQGMIWVGTRQGWLRSRPGGSA